jgi:hypothetical protein
MKLSAEDYGTDHLAWAFVIGGMLGLMGGFVLGFGVGFIW